jgi:hypothetical protein
MAQVWSYDTSTNGGEISTQGGNYCVDGINGQYIRHASCRQFKCFLTNALSLIVDQSNKLVLWQCNKSKQQDWILITNSNNGQISIELFNNESSFFANLIPLFIC